MNNISNTSNIFVKTDCFCDYVPFVSSITNLVDLFQKCVVLPFIECVVLPFIDNATITSNHYYKHINEKSFVRCFLLVIPVIGNLIVGIYDLYKKKHDDDNINDQIKDPNTPIGIHKIDISNISLDDVEMIVVNDFCAQSSPCQHQATVILKDGREAFGLNSYDICSIVSKISECKINPGKKWNAEDVKKHFSRYSTPRPDMGWEPKSAEEVLKNLHFKNK